MLFALGPARIERRGCFPDLHGAFLPMIPICSVGIVLLLLLIVDIGNIIKTNLLQLLYVPLILTD